MAGFGSFGCFMSTFPLMEMDSGLELMDQSQEFSVTAMGNQYLDFMDYSSENSFMPQLLPSVVDNFSTLASEESYDPLPAPPPPLYHHEEKVLVGQKRKATSTAQDSASRSCSVPLPEEGSKVEMKKQRKNGSGKGKGKQRDSKEMQNPMEVVHVRARRGEATDSHSLAERVRREKINGRMRCLKDLVPGCYKAMGMAVMLDEIINYVQSLQNQVEFLSMKLSAASSFYDFNADVDLVEMPMVNHPKVGNGCEGQEVHRLMKDGYGGGTTFQPTFPF